MSKDILIAFGIACTAACAVLVAHVNDTDVYDYTHDYSHQKKEFDSQPHHDGQSFPDFAAWMDSQMAKEQQAKDAINAAALSINPWIDPFTAGINAAIYIVPGNNTQDHDHQSAEHESEH